MSAAHLITLLRAQVAVLAAANITDDAVANFWSVVDLLGEHIADVMTESEGKLDPEADLVADLLYDAILYDAAKALGVEKPKTTLKRKARRMAAALLRFNSSTPSPLLAGRTVARFTAQLGALEFFRIQSVFLSAVHSKLRSIPSLVADEDAGSFIRGVSCVFLASGREPCEGSLRSPQATLCMAMGSEDPIELAQIGNIYCTSSLAARAQISAALAVLADATPAGMSLMFPQGSAAAKQWQVNGGGEEGGQQPRVSLTPTQQSELMEDVVARLHAYDVEAFGIDGSPLEAEGAEAATPPPSSL